MRDYEATGVDDHDYAATLTVNNAPTLPTITNPAGQSDGDGGPDGDVHGGGDSCVHTHGAVADEHGCSGDV